MASEVRTGERHVRDVGDLQVVIGVDHNQAGFGKGPVGFSGGMRMRNVGAKRLHLFDRQIIPHGIGGRDGVDLVGGLFLWIGRDHNQINAQFGEFGEHGVQVAQIPRADWAMSITIDHDHLPVVVALRRAKHQFTTAQFRDCERWECVTAVSFVCVMLEGSILY